MWVAHPTILRGLVEQYNALRMRGLETEETRRRLEDITYTLCVSTGTQTIEAALVVAEEHLNDTLLVVEAVSHASAAHNQLIA